MVRERRYINCPMNEQQYKGGTNELIKAETVPQKAFERLFSVDVPVSLAAVDMIRFDSAPEACRPDWPQLQMSPMQ